MKLIRAAAIAAAAAMIAAMLGAGVASADPPAPADPSLEAPAWAPRKPAESWQGHPMVWWDWGSGGHWGVWINGQFLPFT